VPRPVPAVTFKVIPARADMRRPIREAIDHWFKGPVHSLLSRAGFALATEVVYQREPLQMFRSLPRRIDVVGLRIVQRLGDEETEVFCEVGVFVRSIPHYKTSFAGVESLSLKSTLDCHFRQCLRPSWWLSPSLSARTTWFVSGTGSKLEKSLNDIFRRVEGVGLPWFDKFGDLRVVYEVLKKKRRAGPNLPGDWGQVFGEKLVKGFLGLECRDWSAAIADLNAALALENPRHALDPSQPARLYGPIEREIEAGLAKAKAEIEQ
jgi:hypothetical protein